MGKKSRCRCSATPGQGCTSCKSESQNCAPAGRTPRARGGCGRSAPATLPWRAAPHRARVAVPNCRAYGPGGNRVIDDETRLRHVKSSVPVLVRKFGAYAEQCLAPAAGWRGVDPPVRTLPPRRCRHTNTSCLPARAADSAIIARVAPQRQNHVAPRRTQRGRGVCRANEVADRLQSRQSRAPGRSLGVRAAATEGACCTGQSQRPVATPAPRQHGARQPRSRCSSVV